MLRGIDVLNNTGFLFFFFLSCVFGHVCYWCKEPNNSNKQLCVYVFLILVFVSVLSCVLFLLLSQSENKIIIKELQTGEEKRKNLE